MFTELKKNPWCVSFIHAIACWIAAWLACGITIQWIEQYTSRFMLNEKLMSATLVALVIFFCIYANLKPKINGFVLVFAFVISLINAISSIYIYIYIRFELNLDPDLYTKIRSTAFIIPLLPITIYLPAFISKNMFYIMLCLNLIIFITDWSLCLL